MGRPRTNTPEKFWAQVDIRGKDECWLWKGSPERYNFRGKRYEIHIASWLFTYGVLPEGKIVDRICKNSLCANPFHVIHYTSLEDKFCSLVNKNGPTRAHMETNCWIYIGTIYSNGYGMFHWNKWRKSAHIVSWELNRGKVPGGLFVCHHCDNPPCIRLDHLFLGTTQDNTRDRHNKGRDSRGGSHGLSKLTNDRVIEIRKLYPTGNYTQQKLAEMFDVDQTLISLVVRNKIWKHVA